MAQTFRIATAEKGGGFILARQEVKVPEELFWSILRAKVKEITCERPERFDETLSTAKEALNPGSLIVIDVWFEVKGRK
jgi:hypothetical protein